MKYIVLRYKNDETSERVYMFPQQEKHDEFAERAVMPDWRVVRGGFVMLESGKLYCYGEAFSLGLTADKERDTKLLYQQLDQG